MKAWIWFIILLGIVWFFLAAWLGISGLIPTLVFALALALSLDFFGVWKIFPFKLKRNIAMILLIGLWGFLALQMGWLGGIIPGFQLAAVTPITVTPTAVTPTTCMNSVSEEIRGTTATIDVNAWDQESNTPYSAAVDFTTNCWVYKNGKEATNYVTASSDTSAASLSGYSVGDTIYIYCGGTTYYGEPVEGVCVNTQRFAASINAHILEAEASLLVTGYDSTGSATLSTGDFGADYKMSLGANGEDSIFLKLKVNSANNAYQFCGWGTFMFYNMTSVEPQSEESTYTKIATPLHMSGLDVDVNSTSGQSVYGSYALYKASSPILLHEWDSIKEQFIVTAHTTSDPLGYQGASTTANGFAVIAKDCAYSRGGDGKVYLDIYGHDTSEADKGLDETDANPDGLTSGVTIEVE